MNLAVAEIYEVRAYVTLREQLAVNTRHYRVTNVTGTVSDAQFAANVDAAWAAPYKAAITGDASYRGVGVARVFPLPRTLSAFSTTGQGPGGGGTDELPSQVSGIITFTTIYAGPAYRGRIYVPFPDEAFQDLNGQPGIGYQGLLDTLKNVMDVPFVVAPGGGNSATLVPVIYDKNDNTYIEVAGSQSRKKWATQRRRGGYGQSNQSPI